METKSMPNAPPPYYEHTQGQPLPYGFTTNAGQPNIGGPITQPLPAPPKYDSSQMGYVPGQPGYSPAQPGYPAPQTIPSVSHPGSSQTVVVQPQGNQTVILVGGCPKCRVGTMDDSYTCLGLCCAICFFPIGILCCLAMKEKRCQNCNFTL